MFTTSNQKSKLSFRTPNLDKQSQALAPCSPPRCFLKGGAFGAIVIRRNEVRPFSVKQIELLRTFADQTVIAIENVRLFQEIQEKSRQLETANERLKDLDRLKSDFVSNVSHQLRTPLTAIKGAVDLLLREVPGPLNENQTHHLSR